MTERLVVIGADAGGMTAASQARRRRGPDELEIVAFDRGRHTSYSACGIPYFIAGDVQDLDDLVARTPEAHRAKGIDVRLRHEVVGIDLERRAVRVRDLDAGGERDEPFDSLVYATGSEPIRPRLPGADAEGIHGVQTLDDGAFVRRVLDTESPRRAVVVGGGYIGLEMAEAFVKHGLDVTLVEGATHPMTTLDPDMGALVGEALRGLGVTVYEGETVTGFGTDGGGRVTSVATAEREVPADIVLLGLGNRPAVALAEDAGIPLGPSGGIAVDRRMLTQVPAVWAAGDCVESFHRVSRRGVVIALGTHANKQGRVAGINIGGGYATFAGVVGTAVSKICDYEVARTGLNEREAAAAGFQHVTAVIEGTTRAGYFPGTQPIRIKMLAERGTGRLLGAQIIGREGAAKRIDVVALALWREMTVEELLGVDLSYAPPFSPVWDPVLVAARKTYEVVQADR